jgi:DNA-binding transcriptional LysR family regulator
MQSKSWSDWRYLLAVWRGHTLSAAAKLSSVDDTTVSSRLAALELDLGTRLVRRLPDNRLALTEVGEMVARQAEAMERGFQLVGAIVGSRHDVCVGTVRVTAVPILANRLLAPAIGSLLDRHPGLNIELIPDARDYNLTRREADIALRLARPTAGGMNVNARRIARLEYAGYGQSQGS